MTVKVGDIITIADILTLEKELDTRVYSTQSCITLDYKPTRRNIVYDANTMTIVRIYFG